MMAVATVAPAPPGGFGALFSGEVYSNPLLVQFLNLRTYATSILPAPQIGDSFKLNNSGIVRKSRGLEINSVQIANRMQLFNLSWTWANLCGDDLGIMEKLIISNIGDEYLMLDVGREVWRIIILTISNKFVQQAKYMHGINLEAQGFLL